MTGVERREGGVPHGCRERIEIRRNTPTIRFKVDQKGFEFGDGEMTTEEGEVKVGIVMMFPWGRSGRPTERGGEEGEVKCEVG